MMAVAENRPTHPVQPTPPLPEFYSGQTFRVTNPDRVIGDIVRITSISSAATGDTIIYYAVNGAGVKRLTAVQFCQAYPNRVQIPG